MFTIHVVNSVKGGCGKSTFCLFLENFLLDKKEEFEKADKEKRIKLINHDPIIIDLDLSGSSWYWNYNNCLKNYNVNFLNDLIYDYDHYSKQNYIFEINESIIPTKNESSPDGNDKNNANVDADENGQANTETAAGGDKENNNDNNANIDINNDEYSIDRVIEIVMADPNRVGNAKDEELDLFENSICRLIKDLEKKGKTDIILDMPPGYEDYTERIVNHILFDLDSPLYKEYVVKGKGKENVIGEELEIGQTEYNVKFYMLSGVDSSIEANAKYISNFYKKANYSAVVNNLKENDIYFVMNDIENAYEEYLKKNGGDTTNLINSSHSVVSLYLAIDSRNIFYIPHIVLQNSIDRVMRLINGPKEETKNININISEFVPFNKGFKVAIPTEKADD